MLTTAKSSANHGNHAAEEEGIARRKGLCVDCWKEAKDLLCRECFNTRLFRVFNTISPKQATEIWVEDLLREHEIRCIRPATGV